MLSAEHQAKILSLHFGEGKSTRAIARELGINRKTVAAVIERRSVRLGADVGVRKSRLDPYKTFIEEKLRLDPMIPATVLLQQIRKQGYPGGISQLRSYVAAARDTPRPKEAFLRLNFEAGECAQVDWGEFGDVFGTGVKIHAFLMVLCYSRRLYVEFTRAEKFEDFVRCHQNAFSFFGGVPRECWFDNLATCVTERVGRLVRFNARFHAYLGHHAVRPYACTPARGNEKGRVEDGVKYLRSSFWPGRHFLDFDNLNVQAREWMQGIANSREHRATRRVPELVFENEEKARLLPLNPESYDTDEVYSRGVPSNFRIPYDTNLYSVPWTLTGFIVTVRITAEKLHVFYQEKHVTTHDRRYTKHGDFEKPEHRDGLVERKPGANHHAWQVAAVRSIGPALEKYLQLLQAGHRSLRHECARILALATVYGNGALHETVEQCLSRGIVGAENLEILLKQRERTPEQAAALRPPPLVFKAPKLNRMPQTIDLRRYDELLFDSPAELVSPALPEPIETESSPREPQGETP